MYDKNRFRETAVVTLWALATNITHGILGISFGAFTGCEALLASGVHSMTDTLSAFFALAALRLGSRGADTRFHYGYRRIETLAALFVAFMLVYAVIEIVHHAFEHEVGHEDVIKYKPLVLVIIFLIIATKEWLFRYTKRNGIRLQSPLLISRAWHYRADALGFTVVFISVVTDMVFPGLKSIDAIATIIVCGMILHTAWEIGYGAVKELIDHAPSIKTMGLIEEMAERVSEVTFTHDIRIRTMGGALIVELTAEVSPTMTVEESSAVAEKIRQEIWNNVEKVLDVRVIINPKGEYLKRNYPEGFDQMV